MNFNEYFVNVRYNVQYAFYDVITIIKDQMITYCLIKINIKISSINRRFGSTCFWFSLGVKKAPVRSFLFESVYYAAFFSSLLSSFTRILTTS